jgi:membrane complex biogenesis BtpA family protein
MTRFSEIFTQPKPLIGVIHLPPLPGYAACPGIDKLVSKALGDLQVCERAGLDGVLVENEYDRPHRLLATAEITAAMTRITHAVQQDATNCVTGCEILLNDPRASLAVAKASGACFIRTDYFTDPMYREQYGNMAIDAPGLLDYRKKISAEDVLILADIQVKYAKMTVKRSLAESARIAGEAGADAIIVTGDETGHAPSLSCLREVKQAAGKLPVLIGSGCSIENAGELLSCCDGAIVGTSLIENQQIDFTRAAGLVRVRDNLMKSFT